MSGDSHFYHHSYVETDELGKHKVIWNDDWDGDCPIKEEPEIGSIITVKGERYYVLSQEWHEDSSISDWDDHGCDYDVHHYHYTFLCKLPIPLFRVSVNPDQSSCSIIKYIGSETTVKVPCEVGGKLVVSIASDVFRNNTVITEIQIPVSVSKLPEGAFANCTSLKKVVLPAGLKELSNLLFKGCTALESVNIPDSVETIQDGAFKNCKSLEEIYIPASVEKISTICPPFEGCNNLKTIVVDKGNKVYDSRDNCNAVIETKTNRMLVGCKRTTIPKNLSSIGYDAKEQLTIEAKAAFYKKHFNEIKCKS